MMSEVILNGLPVLFEHRGMLSSDSSEIWKSEFPPQSNDLSICPLVPVDLLFWILDYFDQSGTQIDFQIPDLNVGFYFFLDPENPYAPVIYQNISKIVHFKTY